MTITSTAPEAFRSFFKIIRLFVIAALCALCAPAQEVANAEATTGSGDERERGSSLNGRWQAQLQIPSGPVNFGLELLTKGENIEASILNGPERLKFTGGSFKGDRLRLTIDYYDGELSAQLDPASGALIGEYTRQTNKGIGRFAFRAVKEPSMPIPAPVNSNAQTDKLIGDWVVTLQTKNRRKQDVALFTIGATPSAPPGITATLIPVSGDYGLLAGTVWRAKQSPTKFQLSRFDGIHVTSLTGTLLPDGTLRGELSNGLNYRAAWTALPKSRAASGKAPLFDPFAVAKIKDPSVPLGFALPDLSGQTVTLDDERFRGKALIVDIFGTWCPNCHDETPLLVELYEKYKGEGLEIVGLAYEYPGEATRADRQVETFRRRYGIKFPLLLAGTTDEGEIARTLPQLENFSAYPTTLFINRDGRVHKIHTGFSGPTTGLRFLETKREFERIVQDLLKKG